MISSNKSPQSSYPEELRALVNDIKAHKGKWYKSAGGDETEPGVIEMPYTITDSLAMRAMKFLYDHKLVIDFDWGAWDEGRKFFENDDASKYDNLDKEFVLKLLTAACRNDRFNEGAWARLFESGDAQKLYSRLLELTS